MTATRPDDLTTAVARAVRARDRDAERAARAELAAHRLRATLTDLAAAGVRLDPAQLADLHQRVDRLAGGRLRARFTGGEA